MLNFYTQDFKIIDSITVNTLMTNLLNEVEVTLIVKNDSVETSYTNIGLFLKPSSDLGSIDKFTNKSPESSYEDILSWGSINKGLSLKVDEEYIFFRPGFGSENTNKLIIKDTLNPGDSIPFIIKLTKNDSAEAQRLYIGLEVE